MLKELKIKIVKFIDKLILPSIETHQKRYKKKEKKIKKGIIKGVTINISELKNLDLDSYKEIGFFSIYFKDYENFVNDLRENKPISPSYQEDGIWKDIMLSIYRVRDSRDQTWVLVVDMTNSPNIGLRDYWRV